MGLLDWLKPPPPPDAALQARIEQAVATVDPLIGQVKDYARQLAPAVAHAWDYCAKIAATIPGPYPVSRNAFSTDPLIHALFGSADDIETMFATSQCVRDHLHEMALGSGRCCALLGMRHREKTGFGVALQGEVVRSDVPQKTLYFSDHTLAELGPPDADAARRRLAASLFDGLLKGFAAHVADVRAERDELRREEAFTRAWARAGRTDALEAADRTRRQADLERRLRANADALQPERLLATLVAALNDPTPYLRLDPVSIAVDRTGVITDQDAGAGDVLHFHELTVRDQRRWVVMLVLIDHADVKRALERFESARRYIVI